MQNTEYKTGTGKRSRQLLRELGEKNKDFFFKFHVVAGWSHNSSSCSVHTPATQSWWKNWDFTLHKTRVSLSWIKKKLLYQLQSEMHKWFQIYNAKCTLRISLFLWKSNQKCNRLWSGISKHPLPKKSAWLPKSSQATQVPFKTHLKQWIYFIVPWADKKGCDTHTCNGTCKPVLVSQALQLWSVS